MRYKSTKSILEAGIKHVEKNGMDRGRNCPRFIIRDLAKETEVRSVIYELPRDVSAANALKLLDRAAKEDGASPALKGPGEYAEGWAQEHRDDPDLFVKALELLK